MANEESGIYIVIYHPEKGKLLGVKGKCDDISCQILVIEAQTTEHNPGQVFLASEGWTWEIFKDQPDAFDHYEEIKEE